MSNVVPMPLSNIDQQLAEIRSMVDALIFMQEEADADKLASLHDATVAMLYIINDKVSVASGSCSALHRREYRTASR